MTTRQRSQMPPPASYRTPMPTNEISQDGILHPALTPRRRIDRKGGVFYRLPAPDADSHRPTGRFAAGPSARPAAMPGDAPVKSASDRARDDRLFEDLAANAADAGHTRDRDELEADDDFAAGDVLDAREIDEIEKAAQIESRPSAAMDDEEAKKAFPED